MNLGNSMKLDDKKPKMLKILIIDKFCKGLHIWINLISVRLMEKDLRKLKMKSEKVVQYAL